MKLNEMRGKKLVIGFDGEPHGHLYIDTDGKIRAAGPNVDALKHHFDAACEELGHLCDESKCTSEAIMNHLAERLQGRTHAHWE